MRKRREINIFSISLLDLLSGALGAVIILYVAMPKHKQPAEAEIPIEVAQVKNLEKVIEKKNEEIASLKLQLESQTQEPMSEAKNFDVGFRFKGKHIVFLVDTSYSMTDEDRMGQVKAGLKMLLTSLPSDYEIDVIQFPFGTRAPFRSLWGTTRKSINEHKQEAFEFIQRLRPQGGTPTREALLFALRNYAEVTDFVLLSDGAPTFHNSNKTDDIDDLLRVIVNENSHSIQINTIGVGADFFINKSSDRFKFLSQLAQNSGGFFVGF